MDIKKQEKKFKDKLHNSIDVASRNITKNGVEICFVYLKSITDNLVFSQSIFEPISIFEGEISFDVVKQIVKSNDVAVAEEKQVVEKFLKGGVAVFLSNNIASYYGTKRRFYRRFENQHDTYKTPFLWRTTYF